MTNFVVIAAFAVLFLYVVNKDKDGPDTPLKKLAAGVMAALGAGYAAFQQGLAGLF